MNPHFKPQKMIILIIEIVKNANGMNLDSCKAKKTRFLISKKYSSLKIKSQSRMKESSESMS